MKSNNAGFTLIELLVSILVVSIIMTAVVVSFAAHSKNSIQQDRLVGMEENLRAGMGMIAETLRNAGYGVPRTQLNVWLNDNDFSNTTNIPLVFPAQQLKVATCTAQPVPVATLTQLAPANSTTLTLNSVAALAVGRSIWIGRAEFARITNIAGNVVTIDTNMTTSGNQAIFRQYPVNTPICRIDVLTLTVNPSTGVLTLLRNDIPSAGAQVVAEGITNLQVSQIIQRRLYQLDLTATATNITTGGNITRTLRSEIAFLNG